jgi:predicted nucleotidyltransferase
VSTLLDIGPSLVTARRARGLSQVALGELLGVKQQQVQRWEATGYRNVTLERIARVAEALGVDASAPADTLMAAEAPAVYGAPAVEPAVRPARDLGEIIARIREHGDELRERFTFRSIGVFGSFITGEQTDESDVDLIVEMETRTFRNDFAAQDFLEGVLGRKVDLGQGHLLHPRIRDRVMNEVIDVWKA